MVTKTSGDEPQGRRSGPRKRSAARTKPGELSPMELIAANVVRLRKAAGWTVKELAEQAGLHWRHVQKIETGQSNVTLVTITRLVNAFQVDPVEIFDPIRRPRRRKKAR